MLTKQSDLEAVVSTLNTRPGKILGWLTPAEAFNELLRSVDLPRPFCASHCWRTARVS